MGVSYANERDGDARLILFVTEVVASVQARAAWGWRAYQFVSRGCHCVDSAFAAFCHADRSASRQRYERPDFDIEEFMDLLLLIFSFFA